VAIYSTFFVAAPETLLSGFPGWKLPLDTPVKREFTDFFGGRRIIETRAPLWEDVEADEEGLPEYRVVAIQGNYEDYLEERLPAFVREVPHFCAKGLTEVEIDPLGKLTDGQPALEEGLFAPPSRGASLLAVRPAVVDEILNSQVKLAQTWAAHMSTPDYTHSADGSRRLNDDWSLNDALGILAPLRDLARKAGAGERLYLLVEG
jgi:hypothetical protein